MKFSPALDTIVSQYLSLNIVVALMGESGIGKSSFLNAVAANTNTKCFTLQCNNLSDKADLTGVRTIQDEATGNWRQAFFPHEDVMAAVEYAQDHPDETVLLNLDEINRTNSDITSALLTIPTARKLGRVELPANLRVAVTGNLVGDVVALDEASLSRFAVINVEPDADTFIELHKADLNKWVKSVLEANPELIFCRATATEIAVTGTGDDDTLTEYDDILDAGEHTTQITTPRTLKNLSDWLNTVDRNQLSSLLATPMTIGRREVTMLDEVVETLIGTTEFATLLVSAIADDLRSSSQSATPVASLAKPAGYDSLKAATSITDLSAAVTAMPASDRSASLVYALSEVDDNSHLIEALGAGMTRLEGAHTRELTTMLAAQQAYMPNVEALMHSQTGVGTALQPMIASYIE